MEPPIQPGETWRMFVVGTPATQGSKTIAHGNGRSWVRDDDRQTKPWKQSIAELAIHEWAPRGMAVLDEPVCLTLCFVVKRPQSHFRKSGQLSDSAPLYPATSGGDLDKLARAVGDALIGIVYRDDRRVVSAPLRRRYGPQPGVYIAVRRMHALTVGDLRRLRGELPDLADALQRELQLTLAV
jgi:crossover junction endodeoxyribonuclease RusA